MAKTGEMRMMFVTLGSQKFQFNRLLKTIDELLEKGCIEQKVFAQIGHSDYEPRFYAYTRFLDREEYARIMDQAEVVVTHGGTGSILGALKKGKKVIAVPRLAKYGEHVDDHQLQLVHQFDGMNLLCACEDCAEIESAYRYAQTASFSAYCSNTQNIIASIEAFIDGGTVQ